MLFHTAFLRTCTCTCTCTLLPSTLNAPRVHMHALGTELHRPSNLFGAALISKLAVKLARGAANERKAPRQRSGPLNPGNCQN